MTTTDVDTILGKDDKLTLSSGMEIRILPLKTRQVMRALKILTANGAENLFSINFSKKDVDEVVGAVLGAVVFSIPDAEDETIAFIQSVIEPYEYDPAPKTKMAIEKNEQLLAELYEQTVNPDLEDLVDIVAKVVENERDNISALGKKVQILLNLEQKTQIAKGKSKTSS